VRSRPAADTVGDLVDGGAQRNTDAEHLVRKLILLSILLVSVCWPIVAARDPVAIRGLRRTIIGVATWIALYVVLLMFVLRHY